MSHHDKELYPEHNTQEIHALLLLHGLPIDTPSQAADCFRFGFVAARQSRSMGELELELEDLIEMDLSNADACKKLLKTFGDSNE